MLEREREKEREGAVSAVDLSAGETDQSQADFGMESEQWILTVRDWCFAEKKKRRCEQLIWKALLGTGEVILG